MKLYYKAGACSLAAHITLIAAGLEFSAEAVDLKTKVTEGGDDFLKINPKGYVPALKGDDGTVLTEGGAILLYLAAQAPQAGLAPLPADPLYPRLVEWLVFIATELHKGCVGLFNPAYPPEAKEAIKAQLQRRFAYTDQAIGAGPYLLGARAGVADFYLFTVLSWLPRVGITLTEWPALAAHYDRVRALPAVQAALRAEKLI
ncbi:glutathione transferase GstA [Phaeospirillum tilakii]|uniref:Glutathione transferase GstA n=1 Tax=Phaeospirillum tilakii TaxID=741673 RepID=A0ABW5CBL3_9PROT